MDISSPVTATASSSFNVNPTGVLFAPELAVQADTSFVWVTCFLSKKEPNPWFKLEFNAVTSISNVRLAVRTPPSGRSPADFSFTGMDQLSVYVSNSSSLTNSSKELCGDPWKATAKTVFTIVISCKPKKPKGRFLYVTVPSTNSTYLVLCSIVLNRERGNVSMLHVVVLGYVYCFKVCNHL